MNYLAHAYLSFRDGEILTGNMISDFVKGKKKFEYPLQIQKGIALHRAIDEFTDSHEQTRKAKSYFKGTYGLYSGAFIDIVYDHFLAKDTKEFANEPLASFSKNTYALLQAHQNAFPEKFHQVFHYMQLHDWLYNYQFKEAIGKSFRGLVYRAAYMHDSATAFSIFNDNYEQLNKCYDFFFPLVKQFAYQKFNELLKI
ncbi:MAG TPA: ACP phosphodiesterase [Puia sp.]|nr:ACP phosphodiesterase [Puia sp.]